VPVREAGGRKRGEVPPAEKGRASDQRERRIAQAQVCLGTSGRAQPGAPGDQQRRRQSQAELCERCVVHAVRLSEPRQDRRLSQAGVLARGAKALSCRRGAGNGRRGVGMSLQMSRAERESFLADVHVGVISIEEPGRGPLSVPIWYAYQPGGELWLVT